MCESGISKEFRVVKFEENEILLVQRGSKRVFQYLPLQQGWRDTKHPYLCQGLVYGAGVLYPRGITCLANELQVRRRAHTLNYFSQEQLANTFVPLWQCVQWLHKEGVTHGSITTHNLIMEEQGMRLRGLFTSVKVQTQDDILALAQLLVQTATLGHPLTHVIDVYSKGMLMTLLAATARKLTAFDKYLNNEPWEDKELNAVYDKMLLQNKRAVLTVTNKPIKIINTDTSTLNQSPLKKPLSTKTKKDNHQNKKEDKIKLMPKGETPRERRINNKEDTFNSINHQEIKYFAEIQLVQVKKEEKEEKKYILKEENKFHLREDMKYTYQREDNKHTQQREDSKYVQKEQSKFYQRDDKKHEEIKKKQIEKINKIIEKSNEFVKELMARKGGAGQQTLKKMNCKNTSGVSVVSIDPRKKQAFSPYSSPFVPVISPFLSPSRKLRTISRKK